MMQGGLAWPHGEPAIICGRVGASLPRVVHQQLAAPSHAAIVGARLLQNTYMAGRL